MSRSRSPKKKMRQHYFLTNQFTRRILYVAFLGFCWIIFCYKVPSPLIPYQIGRSASVSHRDEAISPGDADFQYHDTMQPNEVVSEGLVDIGPIQNDPNDLAIENNIIWLVALLPVNKFSIASLETTLTVLLDSPGYLNEIVLLSPPEVHQDIRSLLGRVFPEDFMPFLDLSISLWPNGLEEGAALLHAARQISADRFLLMDTTGLTTIDVDTRQMLLGQLVTPLPVGPRGFNLTDEHKCLRATDKPQAAAFLLPPFSVSSVLVPPHDLDSSPVYDVWSALGKHISRARFEHVGGVVVASNSSHAKEWCSGKQPRPTVSHLSSHKDDSVRVDISRSEDLLGDTTNLHTEQSCRNDETVATVFPRLTDVLSFGSALCHMKRRNLQVVLAAVEQVEEDADHLRRLYLSTDCELHVSLMDAALPDSLSIWLSAFSCAPRIFIHSGLEGPVRQACSLATHSDCSDTVIVDIPSDELAFSDWIGSLTFQELHNWHTPRLDIGIMTNDRPDSLSRLFNSLSRAPLFGDTVNIRINIEQTADAETLDLVDQFTWTHGAKFVHRRVVHGGLLPAVVESWYPNSNDSYGLILEDDVELSPMFYAWIKMSLLHYRYGKPEDSNLDMFGISLYQQKNLELRPEGRHRFNARSVFSAAAIPHPNTPFLSQIPCSWGAVYFPEHWRAFHTYLSVRLSGTHPALPLPSSNRHAAVVVAPGLRSNKWTHSWKKYFIELVFLRGWTMLYPNYAGYVSLSTNHLEVGSHVRMMSKEVWERKRRLFVLPLMELPVAGAGDGDSSPGREAAGSLVETGLLDLPEGSMPPWDALPVTDLFGLLTTVEVVKERGSARRTELFGCQGAASSPFDVHELLCFVDMDDLD